MPSVVENLWFNFVFIDLVLNIILNCRSMWEFRIFDKSGCKEKFNVTTSSNSTGNSGSVTLSHSNITTAVIAVASTSSTSNSSSLANNNNSADSVTTTNGNINNSNNNATTATTTTTTTNTNNSNTIMENQMSLAPLGLSQSMDSVNTASNEEEIKCNLTNFLKQRRINNFFNCCTDIDILRFKKRGHSHVHFAWLKAFPK
uniref:Uncharacterized protein n=1 Tax=Glossina brevipalpis TaxID=37001 RepID=A0A1A9X1R7_9MUSC